MCWCQGERQLGFRVPAIWSDSNWPIVIGFVCTSTSTHGKPGTRSRAGLNGGRIGRIRLAFRFVNSYCRKKPQRKDGPFILLNDSFDFTWFNRFFSEGIFFTWLFMTFPWFCHVFSMSFSPKLVQDLRTLPSRRSHRWCWEPSGRRWGAWRHETLGFHGGFNHEM